MIKRLLTVFVCLVICLPLFAQKKNEIKHDTTAYYMRNEIDVASSENDAKALRLIIKEPDGLYRIEEYYMDAKPKMLAHAITNNVNFEAEGMRTDYYPNGNKHTIRFFEKGKIVGDLATYYPNGKLYKVENRENGQVYLKKCQDSTGNVLAENGNGKWMIFNSNFNLNKLEGPVVNGKRDGEWRNYIDGAVYNITYNNGKVIAGEGFLMKGQVFTAVEQSPSFPGGEGAFGRFLAKNIKYPQKARDNKIQGRVILTFVVERDGKLTEMKVIRSSDESLSKEALRVLALSPAWKPGLQNGEPVRVQYSMPVTFTLTEEKEFIPGKSQSGF